MIDFPAQLRRITKKCSWETLLSYKYLFGKWAAFREKKTYYFTNLVFSEKKMDSCYSVPPLGNT